LAQNNYSNGIQRGLIESFKDQIYWGINFFFFFEGFGQEILQISEVSFSELWRQGRFPAGVFQFLGELNSAFCPYCHVGNPLIGNEGFKEDAEKFELKLRLGLVAFSISDLCFIGRTAGGRLRIRKSAWWHRRWERGRSRDSRRDGGATSLGLKPVLIFCGLARR
jgi:hypothetical protein